MCYLSTTLSFALKGDTIYNVLLEESIHKNQQPRHIYILKTGGTQDWFWKECAAAKFERLSVKGCICHQIQNEDKNRVKHYQSEDKNRVLALRHIAMICTLPMGVYLRV